MNKTATITSVAAACAVLGMPAAMAADGFYVLGVPANPAREGFYLGGAGMQSRFDSNNFDIEDVDDEDTGWKAIAGFRFHPNLGVEGSYVSFGNSTAPSTSPGGPLEAKADAISVFGVGFAPIGPVDVFLKAGTARIKSSGMVGAVAFDDKEWEFAYGAGLQFNLGKVALRAEYEKFDTDVIGDLDVISLGATYTFGSY